MARDSFDTYPSAKDSELQSLHASLDAERSENERLKKALEFYADRNTYVGEASSGIEADNGRKAREALRYS